MNARPRYLITHAALATDWVAYFLGRSATRQALGEQIADLPPGHPRQMVLDFLSACRTVGKVWSDDVRAARETVTGETEAGVQSNYEDELTTTRAADMLGVTPRRVRQLAASGELPAHRVGARWRFNPSDIQRRQDGEL
jgi:excisionase family DNA binding protein